MAQGRGWPKAGDLSLRIIHTFYIHVKYILNTCETYLYNISELSLIYVINGFVDDKNDYHDA